jgi:hypothetical protein
LIGTHDKDLDNDGEITTKLVCKQNSFLFRYSCYIFLLRSIISIF